MINGFSINGVHCRDKMILMRTSRRPILPQLRQQYETVPGRDGSYDFSDGTMDDGILTITCSLITDSVEDLRFWSRQVAAWVYGGGNKVRIRFDDELDVFYLGRSTSQIDLEQVATIGEFTLTFRVDPPAYGQTHEITGLFTASPDEFLVHYDGGTAKTPPVITLTNMGGSTIGGFILQNEFQVE